MLSLVNHNSIYDSSSITAPTLLREPFTAVNKFYLFFTKRHVLLSQIDNRTFFHYSNPVVKFNNTTRKFSLNHGYITHEMRVLKEEYVKENLDSNCLCELVSYKNNYNSFFSFAPSENNKNSFIILHKKVLSNAKIEYIKEKCIDVTYIANQEIIEETSVIFLLGEIQKPNLNEFVVFKVFNEDSTDNNTRDIKNILYSESFEIVLNLPYNIVIMDEYTY